MKMQIINLNEKGAVLITGLFFLLFLTILGATALVTTTNDVTMSGNYKSVKEAFYNAEGGVHFAVSAIENGIKAGTFSMPEAIGDILDLDGVFGAWIPSGYNISLGSLVKVSDNKYRITSSGQSGLRGARAKIEATIRRESIEYAAFGDQILDANTNANFLSYASDDLPEGVYLPDAGDTTHEADIGSNGEVNLDSAIVDGSVELGQASGVDAHKTYNGTQTIYGEDGNLVGPVPADPLDMVSLIPQYFEKIDTGAMEIHNTSTTPVLASGLSGTTLVGGETLKGQPGGSNFYFTGINLATAVNLNVVATNGPVNIYVEGKVNFNNSAQLNITGATSEKSVNIYVRDPSVPASQNIIQFDNGAQINMIQSHSTSFGLFTDSHAKVLVRNSGDFKGLVYAPDAQITMANSGNVFGAVWGDKVYLANSGQVFYDTSLQNKWMSKEVILTSWTQVLE
jgi:hypothetical protein